MKDYKLIVIGAGNMGGAMLRGILSKGLLSPSEVLACGINAAKYEKLQRELGVDTWIFNENSHYDMLAPGDVYLLGVKPYQCEDVLKRLGARLKKDSILISMVTGWTVDALRALLPEYIHVLRIMPNTPVAVGAGSTVVSLKHDLTDAQLQSVIRLFEATGKVFMLDERLMQVAPAVSGSSPAYAYLFIEAMADAGVREGLPRQLAQDMAAQALLGAAQMVMQTGEHPGLLKDKICSPGGTTIEAIAALEENGFRHAIISAVHANAEKTRRMEEA